MASKARQAANAARSLRADSNGRLGIGVSAPDGDLHVKQTGEFSTTTNHGAIFIESTDSSESGGYGGAINFTRLDGSSQRRKAAIATKQFGGDGEDVGIAFFTADGNHSTNSTIGETLVIDGKGRVGIGTDPDGSFHVVDPSANTNPHFYFKTTEPSATNNSGDLFKIEHGRGDGNTGAALLNVLNSTGSKFYIRGDGKVGIGTTSPTDLLHVSGSNVSTKVLGKFEHSGQRTLFIEGQWGDNDLGSTNGTLIHNTGGVIGLRSGTSGDATFILKGSNVGIGTTSPSAKLHVSGSGDANKVHVSSTTYTNSAGRIGANQLGGYVDLYDQANGTNTVKLRSYSSSGVQGFFTAGNIGIGTSSPSLPLHVKGSNQPMLIEGTGGGAWIDYDGASGTHKFSAGRANGEQWSVYNRTDATYLMNIMADGKFGLGIVPTERVHIDVGSTGGMRIEGDSWCRLQLKHNTGHMGLTHDSNGLSVYDWENNQYRMTWKENGNVGIGTSSPNVDFQVQDTNARIQVTDGTNSLTLGQWDGTNNRIESANRPLYLTSYSGKIFMGMSGGTEMTVNTNGVGIKGDPISDQALRVNGGIRTDGPGGVFQDLYAANFSGFVGQGSYAGGAMFKTPLLQASSSSESTTDIFTMYNSGHWGQGSVVRVVVFTRYYGAGFKEYFLNFPRGASSITVTAGRSFGSEISPYIDVHSAATVGTNTHSGQTVRKQTVRLRTGGTYYQCFATVELLQTANTNRVFDSASTVANVDANCRTTGGAIHFRNFRVDTNNNTFNRRATA